MSGGAAAAPATAAPRTIRLASGYDMPLVGLGTWKSKDGVVGDAVKAAIRCTIQQQVSSTRSHLQTQKACKLSTS